MMDTSRIVHLFLQYLPDFLKKKLSHREDHFSQNFPSQCSLFASMTNIHNNNEENLIYDNDGFLLLMETAQSNLSLFNVSCDSLIFNDNEDFNQKSRQTLNTIKHYNSSIDIHLDIKKTNHRLTMTFSEEIISSQTKTLQRWKGHELLNICA
ncbi:unnamed protein product [Rotaria sordida]|uniref:Uncharacterized protein n=2 Tax=Rotaria sordida TaxID=392033 RepID=A0A813PAH5_9BILA|nr:unnamed protein product [Rotaria sordida]CAF0830082.1 unnamed protein product [Rotaria sordida]CAF0837682.1 unnamed protein product [Rotaria sordida]CAF0872745.1 unnamed protein product [Rotaria sordida]